MKEIPGPVPQLQSDPKRDILTPKSFSRPSSRNTLRHRSSILHDFRSVSRHKENPPWLAFRLHERNTVPLPSGWLLVPCPHYNHKFYSSDRPQMGHFHRLTTSLFRPRRFPRRTAYAMGEEPLALSTVRWQRNEG